MITRTLPTTTSPLINWRARRFFVAYGVFLALILLFAVAALITPKFFETETLAIVFRQSAQLGIIAIGQTMILLVTGLDLSVGGVIVMTSMVVAEVSNGRDEMIPLSILIALGLGAITRGISCGPPCELRTVACVMVMRSLVAGVGSSWCRRWLGMTKRGSGLTF